MGGEMRLNPDTTAEQRPITVHCLGGCPMGTVTDGDGKVLGTRALWVLDGAAIPGPLGANPSATIAALAERNVRKALEQRNVNLPLPGPTDPPLTGGPSTISEIQQALGQTDKVLSPFDFIPRTTKPPAAQPVGIEFTEVMRGFYGTGDGNRI